MNDHTHPASRSPLPEGAAIRPMEQADLAAVIEIIRQTDEDDADEAADAYRRNALAGEYVLDLGGHVAGVSGMQPIPMTDAAFRLSWTYLHPELRGQGLGKALVHHAIDTLRSSGGRKLFAETSDYIDLDRGDIYAAARELYIAVGFEEEMRHAHYYERNESLIVYGMRLRPPMGEPPPPTDNGMLVGETTEISETDDAYYLNWGEAEGPGASPDDVLACVRRVRQREGRVVFASVPSTSLGVQRLLESSHFHKDGRLIDFYADGVDDIHYRYDLS